MNDPLKVVMDTLDAKLKDDRVIAYIDGELAKGHRLGELVFLNVCVGSLKDSGDYTPRVEEHIEKIRKPLSEAFDANHNKLMAHLHEAREASLDEHPCLIMTRGLPRSGKTTWSKKMVAANPELGRVCPDDVRTELYGYPKTLFDKSRDSEVWEIVYQRVGKLFAEGKREVILDATGIRQVDRDKWVARFPHIQIWVEEFDASKEVCIERAKKDGRDDLIPVIGYMAEQKEREDRLD